MIIRSKHDKSNPYLSISMKLLRDRRLTSEERDCLIMMLSNVDDWEFSYKGLATQLGLKRETVKARVQSLIEKGYVSVSYPLGENGKPLPFAKGVWEIREEPLHSVRSLDTSERTQQCPISGHQALDTKAWAPDSGHQALDTSERTQRNSINVESPTKNQQEENQQEGENHHPLQEAQDEDEAETKTLPPYNPSSFTESSSVANAPSPASKNTGSGEQVMTQREFEFQQFLKKYPKAPLTRELEDTRRAFFEATGLDGSFAEIMAGLDAWCDSVEWHKDNGRWIKKPLNWLKERQWQKANIAETLSDGYFDNLFSTEEA